MLVEDVGLPVVVYRHLFRIFCAKIVLSSACVYPIDMETNLLRNLFPQFIGIYRVIAQPISVVGINKCKYMVNF